MPLTTQVITKAQARQITRGRTPLVPVEYETAIKALSECVTFEDSKYWSDKADALAAWAKIYHSNETLIKAKRLKLHAFRRMGQIANELRPLGVKPNEHHNTGAGRLPGPVSLLRDNGLNKTAAAAARRLALMSETKFEKLLVHPLAPATVAWQLWSTDPAYAEFASKAMAFRAYCRRVSPTQAGVAIKTKDQYIGTAREIITELTEWLDELDQRLKGTK